MKNLTEMTDEQIIEVLADYKAKLDAGVIDFSDESEVSTDDVVWGVIACEYLENTNEEAFMTYVDVYKYFQGEMLSRAGQMPLK